MAKKYSKVGMCLDGMTPVKAKGRWGFINLDGLEIIPCVYKVVKPCKNELMECTDKKDEVIFLNKLGIEVPQV